MALSPFCHKVLYQTTCVEYLTAGYIVAAEIKQSLLESFQGACMRCVTAGRPIRTVFIDVGKRTVAGDRLTLLCKFLGRV